MKYLTLLILFSVIVIKGNAQNLCPNVFKCGDTLVDSRDSKRYTTLQLGTQCWFKENLRAIKYLNGDTIPNVLGNIAWANLTTDAYCWYNDTVPHNSNYGALYNWWVVNDNRSICPMGWYVPTYNEWNILINYEGGTSPSIASNLKSTTEWGGGAGNNSSGFTALGSGWRGNYFATGGFAYMGYCATFWTSSKSDAVNAWAFNIDWEVGMGVGLSDKTSGLAVRCVRDY